MPSATIKVLVVAGGGGGGLGNLNSVSGGGGGGGGVIYDPAYVVAAGSYSVTVGAGGTGGISGGPAASNGGDSSFDAITATGGGRGGGSDGAANSGGSGGGGPGFGVSRGAPGAGTIGNGMIGGQGGTNYSGGGGGGASHAGIQGVDGAFQGANGGDGVVSNISGSNVTYGGGGGGGSGTGGTGGAGGGGKGSDGGTVGHTDAVAGTDGLGGGGGGGANTGTGGGNQGYNAANGGKGVVIVAFPIDGSTGISTSSTGGTITQSGGFQIHTFTSSGTFGCVLSTTPIKTKGIVNALLVGGGGGGGGIAYSTGGYGGGGGGGAVIEDLYHEVTQQAYSIVVGTGGQGSRGGAFGNNGADSTFDNLTAKGGGGGGGMANVGGGGISQAGLDGGTGGGGQTVGGKGSQGGGGGPGDNDGFPEGGGGGGAGEYGHQAKNTGNGNGGAGLSSSISGSAVTYGGGGAGSGSGSGGAGGGGGYSGGVPQNGTANTGGGAAGISLQNALNSQFADGGSGIVIISYASDGSDGVDPNLTTGGTITTSGGKRIHTFTSSGTFTVYLNVGPFSVSDITPMSDNSVEALAKTGQVHDTTIISEVTQFSFINFIVTSADIASQLVTSGYKWLTQSLYNLQQQFTVRPYFTCQIVDDTIQPKAKLFSGSGTPLGNGTMATAPDGTVYAVGLDGSNNLVVYWATALDAAAGVWPNSTILNTSGDNFLDSRNVFSIKISDYFSGEVSPSLGGIGNANKYRITVWYFANFINDGSDLKIKMHWSDDGGTNWQKVNLAPGSLPNNSIGNLSIASMKPVYDGTYMQMGAFYIKKNSASFNSGFKGYDVYYIYGTPHGYVTDVKWGRQVNSYDWTIHSLASYYKNKKHYLVFSAFRNVIDSPGQNANYSIWLSSLINMVPTDSTGGSDLWSAPSPIMPISSESPINFNQLIWPTADVHKGIASIVFKAILVDAVSQTSNVNAQTVTTHTNYMLVQSDDGETFSYPSIFLATNGDTFNSDGQASFVPQNGFWFLGGSYGWLWEYTQNNIVADISTDIIGYNVNDVAGQASSITIQLGNANNKWVGSAPTGPGAAAIAKNKKIVLWQGYYDSQAVPSAVPRNVFYIDDIEQVVSGTQNDVTLVGRDFYKKLLTTSSLFSYQYNGPSLFTDVFDGTFSSLWNQIAGSWLFEPNGNNGYPELDNVSNPGGTFGAAIALNGNSAGSYGSLMKVYFANAASGKIFIYGFFIDTDNYLRLEINMADGQSWAVVLRVAGSNTTLDSGTMPVTMTSGDRYGVFIRRYDYFKFNFMIELYADTDGNSIENFNPGTSSYCFANSHTPHGEYDISSYFTNSSNPALQAPFTIAFGGNFVSDFRWFSYVLFYNQNNLQLLLQKIARIAAIFTFKISYTFRELLFNSTNFTGTFSVLNRILTLTAGNQAISTPNLMTDGEIQFDAKAAFSGSSGGLLFIFRYLAGDAYYFHVIKNSNGTFCRFERNYSSTVYYFYNTPHDVSNNAQDLGSLNLDLTKWNNFRVVMVNGWFYAFINGVMVAAFNDNNITAGPLSTGQWGFSADANTTLKVKNILAPALWKPVQTFSINSGDDMNATMNNLSQDLLAWYFSDMFGRYKAIFLNSTDISTYIYNNQIFNQSVDQSDKEYISQVTVYGNGVSATARNTTLLQGSIIRQEVIVDYTIQTQQDAQTRANNELINANQYLNQNKPKQVINVGAELFDVVTVINTGNNTSGVDVNTRVYTETFNQGGGNNDSDFSLEVDTGNV